MLGEIRALKILLLGVIEGPCYHDLQYCQTVLEGIEN
jgi:hypothetical protein